MTDGSRTWRCETHGRDLRGVAAWMRVLIANPSATLAAAYAVEAP